MSRKDYFGDDFDPSHYEALPEAASQSDILKAIETIQARSALFRQSHAEEECFGAGPRLKTL